MRAHCSISNGSICVVISYSTLELEIAELSYKEFTNILKKKYNLTDGRIKAFTSQFDAIVDNSKRNTYKEIIAEKQSSLNDVMKLTEVIIKY